MTWKLLRRAFDQERMNALVPGWRATLINAAVIDLRHLRVGQLETYVLPSEPCPPLPFPEAIFTDNWYTVVVRDAVIDNERQTIRLDVLAMAQPYDEVDFWLVESGPVLLDAGSAEAEADVEWDVGQRHEAAVLRSRPLSHDECRESAEEFAPKSCLKTWMLMVIRALYFINQSRWLLAESRPARPHRATGKIPSAAGRSLFIPLCVEDVARRYASATGLRPPPIAHVRRGHLRTLRARGTRVWVRAHHVGGTALEWRVGDRHYRVS